MSDAQLDKYKEVYNNMVESEDDKVKGVINSLIKTNWSSDNEAQMKAVQLLKGIALSDAPEANAFMKKIDAFTSKM